MSQNITPKVILITGASSGFGMLTSARLAAAGHLVYATMRDTSKLKPLLEEVSKRAGEVIVRELDVLHLHTIKNVISEIKNQHGRIDVVINNAGYAIGGFFEDLTQLEIRQQMDVNFFGVQNVCREVIPLMRHQKSGKIINISSIAGQSGTPALGAYNASKWALEGFSESLYHELALFGVQVILVEPGSYPTKIFSENSQFAKNFNNPESPYFNLSRKLNDFVTAHIRKSQRSPEVIAKLVEKIINTKNPKLRYVSDFSSWLRIKAGRMVPPSIYNYIFRKVIYGNTKYSL